MSRFSNEKYLKLQEAYDYFDGLKTGKDDYDNGSFKINSALDFKNDKTTKIPQNAEDIEHGVEVILTNSTIDSNIQYSQNSYKKKLPGYNERKSPEDDKVHKGHILAKNLFKHIKRYDSEPQKRISIDRRYTLVYMSEWCNCADNTNCKGQRFFEHIVEDTLNSNEPVEIWYKVRPVYNKNISHHIPVAMHIQGKIIESESTQFLRNGKTYGQSFNVLVPNVIALKKSNLKD